MGDLNEKDRSGAVKLVGADPTTGIASNYAKVDTNGNVQVIPTTAGPVTPGTAATNSNLLGGQFNTSLPTLTTGQQAALQVDSAGRVIIRPLTVADIITSAQGAPNTVANAWPIKITDGTDTALVSTSGALKVNEGLKNGGVQGVLSIPTANTAVEAKVGASRLANRVFLQITPNQNGLFYGFDNTVTVSTGTPIGNGQPIAFSVDPDSTFQIWLVSANNSKTAQILESP